MQCRAKRRHDDVDTRSDRWRGAAPKDAVMHHRQLPVRGDGYPGLDQTSRVRLAIVPERIEFGSHDHRWSHPFE